uniref:Uncharacterized protein n=1 Tax=viral metagenome TaxID=1070528 RepID=A0A6M3JQ73_9ZZZZ
MNITELFPPDDMMTDMLEASVKADDHKDALETIKATLDMYDEDTSVEHIHEVYAEYRKYKNLPDWILPDFSQSHENANKYMFLQAAFYTCFLDMTPSERQIFLFIWMTSTCDSQTRVYWGQYCMATIMRRCGIASYEKILRPALQRLEKVFHLIKIGKKGNLIDGGTHITLVNPHTRRKQV